MKSLLLVGYTIPQERVPCYATPLLGFLLIFLLGCSSKPAPTTLIASTVSTPYKVVYSPEGESVILGFECGGPQTIVLPAASFSSISCKNEGTLEKVLEFFRQGIIQLGAGVLVGSKLNE